MEERDPFAGEVDLSSPRVVAAYDELPLWSAGFGLLLFEELPLSGVRRALDLGCGTGFPLLELAERLGPQARVCGVDPWLTGLARAADKRSARATAHTRPIGGDAARLPFVDGCFDLLVSNLGLNNFDDREAAVAECRRVARPGAVLALTTNLQGHMAEFYEVFDAVLVELGDVAGRAALARHVAARATAAGVEALLTAGGFRCRRVVERRGRLRFADGTALLRHHFIRLGFLPGWRAVVAGRERGVFELLAARLDAAAHEAGGLELSVPMAYIEASAD